jgi:hypothetical protein
MHFKVDETFFDKDEGCIVQATDTTTIQFQSLAAFAKSLGYTYTINANFQTDVKYDVKLGFKGCDTISLNTMVRLHNHPSVLNSYVSKHDRPIAPLTDLYTATRAVAQKVVETCYLQCNRKGVVKATQHQVKFMQVGYYELFMGGV